MRRLLAAGLFLSMSCALLPAQSEPSAGSPARTPDSTPNTGAPAPQALPDRQQMIRERLERLEERMLKLTQVLAENEPDKAEKLKDALDHASERRVKARLVELVALLKASQYSDAEREQEKVLTDLESALRKLTESLGDLERRREERERLEAARKAVRALMTEELEHLERTRRDTEQAERAARVGEMADRMQELADEQAKLNAGSRAGAPPDGDDQQGKKPADAQREEQKKIEEQTRQAAGELRQMGKSGDEQSNPDQQSASGVEQAAEHAEKAAEAMKQSGEQSESGEAGKSAQSGEQAEKELREAAEKLRDEARRVNEQRQAREIERLQRETERKAAELEQQMRGGSDQRQQPGTPNVGKARQNMQRAADRMGEDQPGEAQEQQQSAVDELQQAMDELDDALRQMRREEMEETLAALEARLRALLSREESVQAAVIDLDLKGAPNWGRLEHLQLGEAAQTQTEAAAECASVRRILVEEGTTVIFPEIVAQLAGDMEDIAKRLGRADTGKPTQTLLRDVVETLKELVAAVEQKREEQRQQSENNQQQQDSGDQQQPLLPGSAELKMLKARQIRVHRQTQDLAAGEVPSQPDGVHAAPTEAGATPLPERFNRITEQQRQLAELARKMNEARQ